MQLFLSVYVCLVSTINHFIRVSLHLKVFRNSKETYTFSKDQYVTTIGQKKTHALFADHLVVLATPLLYHSIGVILEHHNLLISYWIMFRVTDTRNMLVHVIMSLWIIVDQMKWLVYGVLTPPRLS